MFPADPVDAADGSSEPVGWPAVAPLGEDAAGEGGVPLPELSEVEDPADVLPESVGSLAPLA